MSLPSFPIVRRAFASFLLIGGVLASGALLAAWKQNANREAEAVAANQPEPVELVTLARAELREHRQTITAIGTVRALRSITLRNEVAGTVRLASLVPGQVVEAGALLVELDASVERAELRALEAQAKLAETMLTRRELLLAHGAIPEDDVDQVRAQRDVALAQIASTRARIAKKVIRAPFRARVGLADVHPGQYLNEGVELTTLQGVSDEAHVDFAVPQRVAAGIRLGSTVEVANNDGAPALQAKVVAIDARVDAATRNATVRARLPGAGSAPAPGAAVRVLVPVGAASNAVAVPVSALRKAPAGDHVWVVTADDAGVSRAHERKVEAGQVLGETVILLAGLTAGEQVAATGSFKLREGGRVQPAAAVVAAPAAQ
jgi:membrane fusion protein (multidrug efflux system)